MSKALGNFRQCKCLSIIIIITLFKIDKNTNVNQATSNKIPAISIEKR